LHRQIFGNLFGGGVEPVNPLNTSVVDRH